MTNFDVIAERIVAAEGISFAIACGIHEHTGVSYGILQERRDALKQAIVEALRSVHIDAVSTMAQPIHVYPDRSGDDVVDK